MDRTEEAWIVEVRRIKEEDAKMAAAFFRRFYGGMGGVIDTGCRWLIFGGVHCSDLAAVRARVKEEFMIEWEGTSDDGVQWAMSVVPAQDGDFSHDLEGYADWVRASEYHEDTLRGIIRRYRYSKVHEGENPAVGSVSAACPVG